ncbi:sodium-dependent multivitamin transporter-like [Glandiceps talaboti]
MSDTSTATFGTVDYAVFGVVLAASAGIGIYYGCVQKKQNTPKEYLLASRQMHFIPVAFSLMASFISAIAILGTPSEVFANGLIYWMTVWTWFIIIPVGAHLYLPVFYKLQLTSIYEYLELRFNRSARILGTSLYIFYKISYLSVAVYAPSLALSAVSGLNVWVSVIAIGLTCTFYTALGGMKAVIWTDVLQSLIMFAGIIAVIVQGCIDLGGIDTAWQIADDGDRIYFFDWSFDPTVRHTMWSMFLGFTMGVIPTYGISQATAQRFFSCPNVREGQKAMYASIPIVMTIVTLTCLSGVVMYATYSDCDPLEAGYIDVPDQRLAYFTVDKFNHLPGLAGLFISATFSGALSSLSSGLNSLAAVTLQDFIKQSRCAENMSEQKATVILKIASTVYGLLAIALVAVVSQMGLVLELALSLGNLILAPILGMFTLGLFFPWTNSIGAISGVISGMSIAMVILIGKFIYPPSWPTLPVSTEGCFVENITDITTYSSMMTTNMFTPPTPQTLSGAEAGFAWFLNMSYLWYSPMEVTVTIIVGIVVSFLTGATDPKSINPELLSPVVRKLCCCLSIDKKNDGENIEMDNGNFTSISDDIFRIGMAEDCHGKKDEHNPVNAFQLT